MSADDHRSGTVNDDKQITMTRRRAIGVAGSVGAGLAAAVLHSRHIEASSLRYSAALFAQEGTPTRGGELVVSDEKAVASLDPHFESVPDPAHSLLFDRLMVYRPPTTEGSEWTMQPALAESWTFADDGLSLDLVLRQGVVFHDGSPWDAETAKWNVERLKSDASVFRTQMEFVTGAEVVDQYTVRLTFSEPTASPALIQLSQVSQMVSRQAVESLGDEEFGRRPVGTGPCRLVEWIPDDSLRLERNPNYWEMGADGQPLPYFDTVRSLHAVDLARAAIELRSDNTMAYQFPPARDIPTIRDNDNLVFVQPPGFYRCDLARVMLNMAGEPFSNQTLRRAAFHALDEAGFANAMGPGVMEPHYTLWWAPGVLGYDENLKTAEYNPELARQLLAEAGYPDGVDIRLKIINRTNDRQAGQIIKQMLDAVGIRTEIESLERVTFNADLAERNYQIAIIGTSIAPDPEASTANFYSGGLVNWGKYSNPEVDRLIIAGRQSNVPEERAEIYKQIQQILIDDAGLKILARHPLGFAISKRLHGVTSSGGNLELRYAWIEQ